MGQLEGKTTDTDGFARFAGERGAEFRQHLAVLFLAGPESSFVAGAELVVDGGMSQV
jgi:NAD(P)-dependent dehydrogenase (short-subunit alcohol dehydrogenase family)